MSASTGAPRPTPSEDTRLDEEITKILASRTFSRSEQMKRLLAYLRDATKSGDASQLTETAIGVQFFGRKDFSPKLDTIVRAEMLRLRRKLDDYYAEEGGAGSVRVGFDRNSYRPVLVPRTLPPAPSATTVVEASALATKRSHFWPGFAVGAALVGLAWMAVALLRPGIALPDRPPDAVMNHPLWRRFQNTYVRVLLPSPLFWRQEHGYLRDFRLNLPADLPHAQRLLPMWPAFPAWDSWTPLESATSAAALNNFLRGMRSTASYLPARQISVGGLSDQRTIVLGSPRMAPLLIDLLADQDFRARKHEPGADFGGFLNAAPKTGEAAGYNAGESTLLQSSDESTADYSLITSMRLKDGGELLSAFGDRVQTAGFLIRKLMEPQVFEQLNSRVFGTESRDPQRVQIVVRVDYNRGTPIGLVYVTHRIHY